MNWNNLTERRKTVLRGFVSVLSLICYDDDDDDDGGGGDDDDEDDDDDDDDDDDEEEEEEEEEEAEKENVRKLELGIDKFFFEKGSKSLGLYQG